MAFTEKSGKGYVVKQGNTGKVLSRFSGKDAKKKADARVRQLHKENNPSSANRGKSAQKKQGKSAKKKK